MCPPSVPRFSDHSVLRHTNGSLFFSFSFLPDRRRLGFDPGSRSSVCEHLNQVADFDYGWLFSCCIYDLCQWASEPSLRLCFSQLRAFRSLCFSQQGCTIFFVAAKKTLFHDHKKNYGKVRFTIMHGWKMANYAGKGSRHGAKWSDTTGQCIYDVERPYTM